MLASNVFDGSSAVAKGAMKIYYASWDYYFLAFLCLEKVTVNFLSKNSPIKQPASSKDCIVV